MNRLQRLAGSLAAAAGLALSAGAAQAVNYSFSQAGFSGGGTLQVSFAATDLDLNGMIDSTLNEVSDFSLSFSGDAAVPSFTAAQTELASLLFQLNGDGVLGNDGLAGSGEGVAVIASGFMVLSGIGPFSDLGGVVIGNNDGEVSTSAELLQMAPVPEPGSAALLLAGLGLFALGRRQRV